MAYTATLGFCSTLRKTGLIYGEQVTRIARRVEAGGAS